MTEDVRAQAIREMDEAVAVMLVELSSKNILQASREAFQVAMVLKNQKDEKWKRAQGVTDDLGLLYESALMVERDPEVIQRNSLARVMMALSPMIIGFQDFVSTPELPLWKVGTQATVLAFEIIGSTQYLESAKLIVGAEYEKNLWDLERRATEILDERTDDPADVMSNMKKLSAFFDNFRGPEYPHEQKPSTFLVLSLLIFIIAYYDLKAALE